MRFLTRIAAQGAAAVIPPLAHRKEQRTYDRHLYKDRNLVERFFNRIKQFRRIATRYEKLVRNYFSMLNLVCAYLWLACCLPCYRKPAVSAKWPVFGVARAGRTGRASGASSR